MRIKIHFFATLRDYVGAKEIEKVIPAGSTISYLKQMLMTDYPRLVPVMDSTMAAINFEYTADEQEVPPDAEIAFFPPVSGG